MIVLKYYALDLIRIFVLFQEIERNVVQPAPGEPCCVWAVFLSFSWRAIPRENYLFRMYNAAGATVNLNIKQIYVK